MSVGEKRKVENDKGFDEELEEFWVVKGILETTEEKWRDYYQELTEVTLLV